MKSFLAALLLAVMCVFSLAEGEDFGTGKLRIGLTAVTLEKDIELNSKLIDLIEKKSGFPTEIIYRRSYQEMSLLLENQVVDVAFVCGLPYVRDHDTFGLELLAAPVFRGKPLYQSYLIVPQDSQARSLKDLRGKVFSFSDPMSNSGFLAPMLNLYKMSETPDSFFSSYFFTYSHSESIEAVAVGLADAANVDSYVWEATNKIYPELTAKTKIISKSDYMPITPIAVRPSLPDGLKTRLKEIFLSLHKSENGKQILEALLIDRFIAVKDSDYDSIRKRYKYYRDMNATVERWNTTR